MPVRPTRRSLLGALGAALAVPRVGLAQAAPARRLIVLLAEGGWDPTFTIDPKLGLDTVDGPEVDQDPGNPFDVDQLTTVNGIPLATNPARRAAVQVLFETWGDRISVVNGLWVGALNHPQGLRRVLTGTPGSGAPDLPTVAGVTHGLALPTAVVDLSGAARFGDWAAVAVRGGARGQLRGLLDPSTRFDPPDGAGFTRPGFTPSEADRAALQGWQAGRTAVDAARWGHATGAQARLEDLAEARRRAAILREQGPELAAALGSGSRTTLEDRASFAVDLLSGGVTQAVLLGSSQHWDTHAGHGAQHGSWNQLALGLAHLLRELDDAALLDETVVAVLSEMGRTPMRNDEDGTDHWPTTSAMLIGAGVSGGRVCGATDDRLLPLPMDLDTGAPDEGGELLRYDSLAAGILDLVGVDPEPWLPGVRPFRGAHADW